MGYNELLEQMDYSLESLMEKLAHEGYFIITEKNLLEEDLYDLWNVYYDSGVRAVVEELEIKYGFEFDIRR